MPELVSDGGRGGQFQLRDILSDEPGMSPLEIVTPDLQRAHAWLIAQDIAQLELTAAAAVADQLRHGARKWSVAVRK
jgi:phosphoribosylformylglycinamidine (FGAM) synthase-like enzyme